MHDVAGGVVAFVVDPAAEPEFDEEDVLLDGVGVTVNSTRRLGSIILAIIVAASALDIAE